MQKKPLRTMAISLAAALSALVRPAAADEVADFYRGKTFTIVVANEVGTGFDVYGRVLARHIGDHIPGHPNVVVQNMVGASGLAAANWLYNVAPKDGSVMATFVHTVPFEPLMGDSAAKFRTEKFTWIGNMASMDGICGVSRASGIRTFDDLLVNETEFGATGATGPIGEAAIALKNLLGAKIKLVPGYKGSASIKLAMQRGEVGGVCSLDMSTLAATWQDVYESGEFKPIIQISGKPRPDLAGLPYVFNFAKTEEDRLVFTLVFGTQVLGRPYASTPDVPAERAEALRVAFTATMRDPQFLADADNSHIDISPMTGAEVDDFIARTAASPPAVIERARRAVRDN
jgi:tripartite-type tricarboxylate transporter receptor subunit TctC